LLLLFYALLFRVLFARNHSCNRSIWSSKAICLSDWPWKRHFTTSACLVDKQSSFTSSNHSLSENIPVSEAKVLCFPSMMSAILCNPWILRTIVASTKIAGPPNPNSGCLVRSTATYCKTGYRQNAFFLEARYFDTAWKALHAFTLAPRRD
jgi:hypothetical protein